LRALFSCLFYSTGGGGGDIEKLNQGRWAGNRVEIRNKEDVASEKEWKDVSKEVNDLLETALEEDRLA
jgi:hypothetical protein